MIRPCGKNQWCVYSSSGKLLGRHSSKKKAQAQLAAIEISKHRRGKK